MVQNAKLVVMKQLVNTITKQPNQIQTPSSSPKSTNLANVANNENVQMLSLLGEEFS